MSAQAVRGRRRRRRPMAEINVVPYIDVMLVLLVIFMVTAPLLTQGVEVELPQASAKAVQSDDVEPLVVTVDAAGRYFLNAGDGARKAVDGETLKRRAAVILERMPHTPVLVKGDRAVPYGTVVTAMVLLKEAGAVSVGLVTQPVPNSGRR